MTDDPTNQPEPGQKGSHEPMFSPSGKRVVTHALAITVGLIVIDTVGSWVTSFDAAGPGTLLPIIGAITAIDATVCFGPKKLRDTLNAWFN